MKLRNVLMFMLLFAVPMLAQSAFTEDAKVNTGDGVKAIYFTGTLNGTDTLTSASFKLYDCNDVFDLWSYHGDNADSVKIKVLRQYQVFGTWTTAKTVYAADSLLTMRVLADTLSVNPVANRLIFIGLQTGAGCTTDNGYNKTFKYIIRAPLL